MRTSTLSAILVLAAAGSASALPNLQFDVNSFHVQAANSGGTPTPFGGLSHTGSVQFSIGSGYLAGIFIQTTPSGPFNNAGLSGFTLSTFSGQINLNNGMVTGGMITLGLNNGDTFTTNVTGGVGAVGNYVGGGFKIEALTQNGRFNDAVFGNVDVSSWFNNQGASGLLGSLLQFNFNPDANGSAISDMDMFVNASVVPLPPAALGGLATLAGVMAVRRIRRR